MIKKRNSLAIISPLGYTGLSYYDHYLSNYISKLKYDVFLITSDQWILENKKNNFKLLKFFKNCSGKRNIFVKTFNYVISFFSISKFIRQNKIKNIHIQILELPYVDIFFFQYLKYLKCNIIYTPHDIHFNKSIPFKYFFIKRLYSISNMIIVHRQQNKLDLISKYGNRNKDKIRVIPHGSYNDLLDKKLIKKENKILKTTLNLKNEDKIFLFFGSIKEEKGINVLLESISNILNTYNLKNIQFIIAGKPHHNFDYNWIISKIDNYQKFKKIIHLDLNFISESKMLNYFFITNFVVLPYLNVSESGVFRLAQTFGKNVICSDLKEFSESINHGTNGFLFKSNDSDSLSKLIVNVLNKNSIELKKISSNFKKEKFDWKDVAIKTVELYK